jgi:hypothetical protein
VKNNLKFTVPILLSGIMPSNIKGKEKERAMFERGEEIYWVDLTDGRVTRVSCVYKGPSGVLRGYELIGGQFFEDSFFDGGCYGMNDGEPIEPSEVPKFVKELLLGEKETTLKKVQELDSKYWKKQQKNK